MNPGNLYVRLMSVFNFGWLFPAPKDATARLLHRLIQDCPLCGNSLAGHAYGRLASVVGESNRAALISLFDLMEAHQWREVSRLNRFESDCINVVVYAIFCRKGGSALAIRSTVDLHEAESVVKVVKFTDDEAHLIQTLVESEKSFG